jgi:hypothetical protein
MKEHLALPLHFSLKSFFMRFPAHSRRNLHRTVSEFPVLLTLAPSYLPHTFNSVSQHIGCSLDLPISGRPFTLLLPRPNISVDVHLTCHTGDLAHFKSPLMHPYTTMPVTHSLLAPYSPSALWCIDETVQFKLPMGISSWEPQTSTLKKNWPVTHIRNALHSDWRHPRENAMRSNIICGAVRPARPTRPVRPGPPTGWTRPRASCSTDSTETSASSPRPTRPCRFCSSFSRGSSCVCEMRCATYGRYTRPAHPPRVNLRRGWK